MRIETRVIPVEGIAKVPDIAEDFEDGEARRQREEMWLLNIATALAVMLVSCAWIAIALD
ncbi:MAG: hypothetical protein AB7V13_31150 [Pseudorhodoplanes sp.]|uniref:hypothetical protein n=1 Tax=Pseudorhodoplanes sp. TaxID=1934341 RepID=UPI003D0A8C84